MNINSKTTIREDGLPADSNRKVAPRMTYLRKIALAAGIFYLLTFVSIPTASLYAPIQDPNYITSSGPDTGVMFGGVLEIIVALAGIGTAVALYPVVKRQNESVALGLVASRTVEAVTIFADVFCILTLVTLRRAGVGADGLVTGKALFTLYTWFKLGQNLMPPVNALLLGYLMYKSGLVPRILPLLGFIGAPLLIANTIVLIFGINTGLVYTLTGIGFLPIAIWEFSLGLWLTFKGFKPSATIGNMPKTETIDMLSAA